MNITFSQNNKISKLVIYTNKSNPNTKGPGKYVGLFRMSEYKGFILVNRNTLGPCFFVGCHTMSENSGVGMHKFYGICTLVRCSESLSFFDNKCNIIISTILTCVIQMNEMILLYELHVYTYLLPSC